MNVDWNNVISYISYLVNNEICLTLSFLIWLQLLWNRSFTFDLWQQRAKLKQFQKLTKVQLGQWLHHLCLAHSLLRTYHNTSWRVSHQWLYSINHSVVLQVPWQWSLNVTMIRLTVIFRTVLTVIKRQTMKVWYNAQIPAVVTLHRGVIFRTQPIEI